MRNLFVSVRRVAPNIASCKWLFHRPATTCNLVTAHHYHATKRPPPRRIPFTLPKKIINARQMTQADLRMVMGWAVKERWNPGRYEVESLYAADPRGYRLLEVNGEPVASLASVRHSSNLAFLGLFIVRPEFRGQGYGKLLWDISLNTLRDYRTVGLNGVLDQVGNYEKSGFVRNALNTRWRGKSLRALDVTPKSIVGSNIKIPVKKEFSLASLIDYDARIFSTPREAFLRKWLKMPDSHVLAALDGNKLRGYGVISACQEGYKIAPLFADNETIAESIYLSLSQCIGEENLIHIDTTDSNSHVNTLAKRFGLEKTFHTLRMYRGEIPATEDSKIFGLTTLEIG